MSPTSQPRDRVIDSLNHKEPDRVPFDLGGNPCAGIHEIAYGRLLEHLGTKREVTIGEIISQQAVVIHEEVLQRLRVDVRSIGIQIVGTAIDQVKDEGACTSFIDEYGIKWVKPKVGGLYYDMRHHPLSGSISLADIKALPMPRLPGPDEMRRLRNQARRCVEDGYAVVVPEPSGGIFELACWLRGFKDIFMDLVTNTSLVASLLDKLVEFRLEYWSLILKELGDLVDIVSEADDVAMQDGLMISPDLYRKILKPRHRKILEHIKKMAKKPVYICFHSCGAVRELIPDFIEIGVSALNPVQISAAGMNTRELKKEFGDEITFWGGGVDTQRILPRGTPEEVKEEVKRRIDDLAPGEGFIFATVHNIQADVPPENIMAMWEALQEYGKYPVTTRV